MSVEALVKPELLIWARESAGYSQNLAAKRIQIKEEKLVSWENGKSKPTIVQLQKVAEVYKRPMAVFYLPQAPKTKDVLHDFRKLPVGKSSEYSPELRYEIRKAQYRREAAIELSASLDDNQKEFELKAKISEAASDVANRVRKFLKVDESIQYAWKNNYDSLNFWKNSIEEKNILVFQSSGIDLEEMRGFSISEQPFPAIVLNSKDSPEARSFTLVHELTHIALGEEGVCNFKSDQSEQFCNAVAGMTLVPNSALVAQVKSRTSSTPWDDREIQDLSNRFRVSRQVILRRLLDIGLISKNEFGSKQDFYKKQVGAEKKSTGGPPTHIKVISNAGTLFTKLVLRGYHSEKITGADVSDFLSVRLKHLPAIESALH